MDWLWEYLVQQRLDRILRGLHGGGWNYGDVIFLLTVAGAGIIALNWVFRKLGLAADEWEKEMRETAELAERKGWHSVVQWHRKFGYTKAPEPAPAEHSTATPENSWLSGSLFVSACVLIACFFAVGLFAWATR